MTGEPTSDDTLTENADNATGSEELANKKNEKGRGDRYQSERVVLCIQNVRDLANTLQPGYQLTTKICERFLSRMIPLN